LKPNEVDGLRVSIPIAIAMDGAPAAGPHTQRNPWVEPRRRAPGPVRIYDAIMCQFKPWSQVPWDGRVRQCAEAARTGVSRLLCAPARFHSRPALTAHMNNGYSQALDIDCAMTQRDGRVRRPSVFQVTSKPGCAPASGPPDRRDRHAQLVLFREI
jgi:hypothetical protein